MPDGNNAVAHRQPSNFEIELANYEPQIAAALPNHIPLERFKRVVLTAINQNPDLYKADRRSLFLSCVRAAQDGLLPDGREAALVIFKTKNRQTQQWVDAVQYMPMIHGIRKKMRNTGEVASADAQIVCENDHFDYELGDNPRIEHKPAFGDRGKPIGAYAIIKLTNGEVIREVMSIDQIERVRAVSRAKDNGPWVGWWEEMARKTVLRRASKAAPMSSDLERFMKHDDETFFAQGDRGQATLAVAPPPRPRREDFAESAADREFREAQEEGRTSDVAVETLNEETEPEQHESADAREGAASPPAHASADGHSRDAAASTSDGAAGPAAPTTTESPAPAGSAAGERAAAPSTSTAPGQGTRPDEFWSRDSYEIAPPTRGKDKSPDWTAWINLITPRIERAPNTDCLMKLDLDNGSHFEGLKGRHGSAYDAIRRKITARYEQLGG